MYLPLLICKPFHFNALGIFLPEVEVFLNSLKYPLTRVCFNYIIHLMNNGIKDIFEHKENPGGFMTASHSKLSEGTFSFHPIFACSAWFAVKLFSRTNWRKRSILQKVGIGSFFDPQNFNPFQVSRIRLKSNATGARNFSNFWRISPGVYTGGANSEELRVQSAELRIMKNVRNQFLLFFYWNLLPANLFQPKLAKGLFRIFRKFFGGMGGGGWTL
jgi:hypothetical protein